jgi:hypothetical protein
LVLLTACEIPFFPGNATAFEPPRSFRSLWAAMEACSGTRADWTRVRWFRAPVLPDNLEGAWDHPHHVFLTEFVLSDRVSDFYREYVVQHEMLHDLLQTTNHPSVFETCGVR